VASLLGKEAFYLSVLEFAPQHRAFLLINAMQGEHALGRIDHNPLNFMWTVLGWCLTTQLWHEMPLGRPPNNGQ
jgi:hypothetical protein